MKPKVVHMAEDIRVERSWHGGHTLIVFKTLGPTQISIDVVGSRLAKVAPRDLVTGREIQHSLGLLEEDILALEDFLRRRRLLYGNGSR